MDEFARLLLLLVFAGAALTLLGALAIRYMDEGRRIRRGLKKVLKGPPHAWLAARGRGRGLGFNFNSDMLAVTWDSGGWCLLYKVEELIGAELIIDGEVTARAYRDEQRRPLDLLLGADEEVRLRLIFDDPRHPDFDLLLWAPEDEPRRDGWTASEAVHEANSWIARVEALLRRPSAKRDAAPAPKRAKPAAPVVEDDDEDPTWAEEEDVEEDSEDLDGDEESEDEEEEEEEEEEEAEDDDLEEEDDEEEEYEDDDSEEEEQEEDDEEEDDGESEDEDESEDEEYEDEDAEDEEPEDDEEDGSEEDLEDDDPPWVEEAEPEAEAPKPVRGRRKAVT